MRAISIGKIERVCWKHVKAATTAFCWKHARAAAAHPEHYVIAIVITVALVLLDHFDVAAVWVLWLDKLLTSVAEG